MGLPKGNITSIGMGVCASHPVPLPCVVTWPAGAVTVLAEGAMVLNATAVGQGSCGCTCTPLSFSATVLDEGAPSHRVGDTGATGAGVYVVTTGAMTVLAG